MRALRRRRHHRRLKLKYEINVVPYIDVMLVLLVIFMVTAPMINSSVDVNLPRAAARALYSKDEPVIVEVDRHEHLFLHKGRHNKKPVSARMLKIEISAILQHNPSVSVLVAGDRTGHYNGIYQVLTWLQQAGVTRVGLMSIPESGKSHARP